MGHEAVITLLEAGAEHADAIVAIERETGGRSLVALTGGDAITEAIARGHDVVVALVDGEVAGWAWCASDLGRGAEEVGQIYRVAVARQHAGSGIGRRLVEHAQAMLAARGVRRVRITVDAADEEAQAFFREMGYAADALTMGREL